MGARIPHIYTRVCLLDFPYDALLHYETISCQYHKCI